MMATAVAAAVAILQAAFPGVHVGTKVPNDKTRWPAIGRPARFLTVARLGGARSYGQDRALIVAQCWAADTVTAEQDAITADDALTASPNSRDDVSRWVNQSIASFPDPDIPMARYQVSGHLETRPHN